MKSKEIVAIGDALFGGDLEIFCDLSECKTPADAIKRVEELISDLRRVVMGFEKIARDVEGWGEHARIAAKDRLITAVEAVDGEAAEKIRRMTDEIYAYAAATSLWSAFTFADTPEGWAYWSKVVDRIEKTLGSGGEKSLTHDSYLKALALIEARKENPKI